MGRQVKFFKTELIKTPHWKDGSPKDNNPKHLCVVIFVDQEGNQYQWVPEKWETNLILAIARNMIKAEEINFPILLNPERRPDIEELKMFFEIANSKSTTKSEG